MRRSGLNKIDDVEISDLSIGPDIEVVPNANDATAVTLEPDLSLHIAPITARSPHTAPTQLDRQSVEEVEPESRRKLIDYFGPEVTAGLVIAGLVAIFAGLLILGVNDQSTEPAPVAPTAPLVSDVAVEIGEGVTLERE